MAALDPSNSRNGRGRFRARPSDDQEEPCLPGERGEPGRNTEEKSADFVNRVSQSTLEAFWTQNVKGEEGFDRNNSTLEWLGAGWTASFLAKVYPSLSRYLIKEFLQAVVGVSIVELLALFVTFGAEKFKRGPVILLTEGVQNWH